MSDTYYEAIADVCGAAVEWSGRGWFSATGEEVEDGWSISLERQGKGPTSSER